MKLLCASLLSTLLFSACADQADDPELGETVSASTPLGGQGTFYNGTFYNGTFYNGTFYNGTFYNGTFYNNSSYGGTTQSDPATITSGTALKVTINNNGVLEDHYPDKTCVWTTNHHGNPVQSCTGVNLSTTPSPLAGVGFPSEFARDDGQGNITTISGTLYIGTATPQVGMVARDSLTSAMHPLTGGAAGTIIPFGSSDPSGSVCTNKSGCRINSDIWLYTLKLWDPTTSTYLDFCPNGAPATALAGTYDSTGERSSSTTQFTFACTNGTIEKCVRWGYRPWASAQKHCDRPAAQGGCTPTSDTTLYSMADYHQACVRGAAADYCASGHSFTKNGTIVDVNDYNPTKNQYGFLPSARDNVPSALGVNGVFFEARFDKLGAYQIDHIRYTDQAAQFGTVDAQCQGTFESFSSTDDVMCPFGGQSGVGCLARTGPAGPGMPQGPTATVQIDSAPSCSHSEALVGKFLHSHCSACTLKLKFNIAGMAYCSDPTDPRGWDANCANVAKTQCTTAQRMASHNECTAGSSLGTYNSGCTIAVCSDPAFASCCTAGASGGWTSACTNAANSKCGFAKKGTSAFGICLLQPTGGTKSL